MVVFTLIPAIGLFAGGRTEAKGGGSSTAADFTGTRKSHDGFPLPIVEKPLQLTAIVNYRTEIPNMETTEVWDWFEKQTNLRVKVTTYTDAEKQQLLFSSREYPDIAFGVSIPTPMWNTAADANDLVPLDDLIKKYAPTWNKFFSSSIRARKLCSLSDGKIYSFPFVQDADFDCNLRDQWMITQTWLDELGLKVPMTTQEFKNVLLAFKNNRGKGSIPANAIPLYLKWDNYANGGAFDIYGSFGVLVTNSDYLAVENGKVVYQAINPAIKEPLKYLQDLFREGLIPPESFTDDWTTFLAKVGSNPPIVGSYGEYLNMLPAKQTPMGPLQSPNGKKPYMRSQVTRIQPQMLTIFSKCPNPVAAVKFAEFVASDLEAKMTLARGMKDVYWKFEGQDKVAQIIWDADMTKFPNQLGMWNSAFNLWDSSFYGNQFVNVDTNVKNSRTWAYNNWYKTRVASADTVYVSMALSVDEENRMKAYGTQLANLRTETMVRWITTNANIDAEWDAYAAKMNSLHASDWLALKQKAYDALMK